MELEKQAHIHPAEIKRLAKYLTRKIFEIGDGPGDKCQRIEFKGGSYTICGEKETNQGGMCEMSLVISIERMIKKYYKYNGNE